MRQDDGISAPKKPSFDPSRSIWRAFFDLGLGDIPADAGAFWYHHDDRISGPGGAPLAGIPPEIIPRHDEPGGRKGLLADCRKLD